MSCAPIYAFGFDGFGNNISGTSFTCGLWEFNPTSGSAPSLSSAGTSHATTVSSTSSHIDGTLTCTTSGRSANVALNGMINRPFSVSAPSWSCQAGNPLGTATVTNSSGYVAERFTVNNSAANPNSIIDASACNTNVANSGTCAITVQLPTGERSDTLAISGETTAGNASRMTFVTQNTHIAGNAMAPNCTNALNFSPQNWTCSGGQARATVQVINNNAVNAAQLLNTSNPVTLSPANGASIDGATTCLQSGSIVAGSSCNIVLTQPNAGQTTTVNLATLGGGYFSSGSVNTAVSPNCSSRVQVTGTVLNACAGTAPNQTKTLRFSVTNTNTLHSFNVSSITDGHANATITNNTCSGNLSANGGSCTFDLAITDAPSVATDANITINTGSSAVIFSPSVTYDDATDYSGGVHDISCP